MIINYKIHVTIHNIIIIYKKKTYLQYRSAFILLLLSNKASCKFPSRFAFSNLELSSLLIFNFLSWNF